MITIAIVNEAPCTMLYDIRMRHAKRTVPLKIGGKDA